MQYSWACNEPNTVNWEALKGQPDKLAMSRINLLQWLNNCSASKIVALAVKSDISGIKVVALIVKEVI